MNETNKTRSELREAQAAKFFEDLEGKIVQRLHAEASTEEGRAELLRNTGIRDTELLNELGKLGITADGLIALRLLPLVLTAWAAEGADEPEREIVMAEALKLGIREGSSAWVLLDQWLKRRPPGLGVDAWKRYTHEIYSQISGTAQQRLTKLTEQQMIAVAKASGGHFGFGKVSKSEQAVIDQVTLAMRQQSLLS